MGIYLPLNPGVMPKNLPVLYKLRFFLLTMLASSMMLVFFAAGNYLRAQEFTDRIRDNNSNVFRWYRSNSSGMMLEQNPSRLAALRNEYCLAARSAQYMEIPELILSYFNNEYSIEFRILYKEGKENRYQWIFREPGGLTRLTASGNGFLFAERGKENQGREIPDELDSEETREEKSGGIVEIRNSEGVVVREFRYDEDRSEWDFQYFYRGTTLLRSEIWFKESPLPPAVEENPDDNEDFPEGEDAPEVIEAVKEEAENTIEGVKDAAEEAEEKTAANELISPPERTEPVFVKMYTDYYRYSRSGSLRAIDRTLHGAAFEKWRVGFPRLGPGVSSIEELVSQGSAYTSEYFAGVQSSEDVSINYNLDTRGRILGEVWKSEDGVILAELKNTWSGNRLLSSLWKTEDDEQLIEFEYDKDGHRVVERNFRRGVLERSVTKHDEREIEEIYMNGRIVLRAYWENGVKVSEQRVSPGMESPR